MSDSFVPKSDSAKGLALAISGVLVISPDTLLIRFLSIDFWAVMFLRGVFITLVLLLITQLFMRQDETKSAQQLDVSAWAMVILMAVSSFFFVAAVQTTSVAHALIIVGSAPMFAALFGWLMLSEPVAKSTVITIAVVFLSLLFVVKDQGQSSLWGDLLALIACVCWSMNFVLARRSKAANMSKVMMYSGALMAVLALPLAVFDGINTSQFVIAMVLGLLNGAALFLLINAPRYIPAAEVAVFLPVETVLGSLLVWWILGEHPGWVSVAGGSVIVLALMLNSWYQMRRAGQI